MRLACRRVAILCVDVDMIGDIGFLPFNYAARRIQAAIVADPACADVEVRVFEGQKRTAEDLAEEVAAFDPDLVGASAYLWSFPVLLGAASLLKRRRPDRIVVFGGPSARPVVCEQPAFAKIARQTIDALVTTDGELVIREIMRLAPITRDALAKIPGVAVPSPFGWRTTPAVVSAGALDDEVPSPYQLGLVPRGLTAHLETFRGCPFECSFCQWGVREAASRVFSKEYLARELESFRASDVDGAFLVDAGLNLSSRGFHNLRDAEAEVGFFKEKPISCEVYPTHITQEHLDFLKAVKVHHVAVGLQTYSPSVNKYLQRRFDAKRFNEGVMGLAAVAPTIVEVILGLPGDDPDGFKRTIEHVLTLPCDSVVHTCLALPDGLLTRAPEGADVRFDPYTLRVTSCRGWTEEGLASTKEWLSDLTASLGGVYNDYSWRLPAQWEIPRPIHPTREAERDALVAASAEPPPAERLVDAVLSRALGGVVARATSGRWRLDRATHDGDHVVMTLATLGDPVVLRTWPAKLGGQSYKQIGDHAFAYATLENRPLAREHITLLDRTVALLGAALAQPDLRARAFARGSS